MAAGPVGTRKPGTDREARTRKQTTCVYWGIECCVLQLIGQRGKKHAPVLSTSRPEEVQKNIINGQLIVFGRHDCFKWSLQQLVLVVPLDVLEYR